MTRTLIGRDSQGCGCVKITKGNIDPFTEPDTNYGSFYYNSKWTKDTKLAGIDSVPWNNYTEYWPAGANAGNYTKVRSNPSGNSNPYAAIRNTNFGSMLNYALPVFDIKVRRLSDSHYIEQHRLRWQGAEDPGGREPGYYTILDYGLSAWFANRPADAGNWPEGAVGNGLRYPMFTRGNSDAHLYEKEVIVWNLPGDETAIQNGGALSPVAGQRQVEITNASLRVSKPGFDVQSATGTQLAFDSSKRPLSAIYANDIDLPVGVTQINLGYPVSARMLCDMFLYQNGIITFPMSQFGSSLVAEYWFSGTSLFINNTSLACRCRFIVFANDRSAPTAGAYKVLNHFNDGTRDVVQFLRPGAANPPSMADIVLDTRWPTLSILAEGYQAIAAQPNRVPPSTINTGQSFTVNFNNNGLFPIVKYMTVHQHSTYGKLVKFPQTLITENYNNQTQYHQGNSTYCVLSNNQATFYTFNGNPYQERYTSSWVMDYVPDPIIGIRYYIIGIAV